MNAVAPNPHPSLPPSLPRFSLPHPPYIQLDVCTIGSEHRHRDGMALGSHHHGDRGCPEGISGRGSEGTK